MDCPPVVAMYPVISRAPTPTNNSIRNSTLDKFLFWDHKIRLHGKQVHPPKDIWQPTGVTGIWLCFNKVDKVFHSITQPYTISRPGA
jgi:hypothetical protein